MNKIKSNLKNIWYLLKKYLYLNNKLKGEIKMNTLVLVPVTKSQNTPVFGQGLKNKCACPYCSNELQDSQFNTVLSNSLGRIDVECNICNFMGHRIGFQIIPIQ